MKKILLISILILIITNVNAQAPRGPNGSSLYKKGGCERVSAKFVSCTYCEDKELTKNCKEYWCTDDGTCTEAPKKNPNGELTRIDFGNGKFVELKKEDTTSKLPKGVKLVNGKMTVQKGYMAIASSDKKIIFLKSANTPGISGSFSCECKPDGSCKIMTLDNVIGCGGDSCCKMITTISNGYDFTLRQAEENPEKLKWKKLVLPAKSN